MSIYLFVTELFEKAKNKIVQNVQLNIDNAEKKKLLDEYIVDFIQNSIDLAEFGFIKRFFIKNILIDNVSVITQCIYDLIKLKIKEITK